MDHRRTASRLLAAQGHRVFLGPRTEEKVLATAKRLQEEQLDVDGVVLDGRSRESIRDFVRAAVDRFGTVDVLVNTAGISGGGVTADIADELWDDIVKEAAAKLTGEGLRAGLRRIGFECRGTHLPLTARTPYTPAEFRPSGSPAGTSPRWGCPRAHLPRPRRSWSPALKRTWRQRGRTDAWNTWRTSSVARSLAGATFLTAGQRFVRSAVRSAVAGAIAWGRRLSDGAPQETLCRGRPGTYCGPPVPPT
ncbi:SDR family NAD(P)-dependent oxidoreductase [Streptomyces avermitilis]